MIDIRSARGADIEAMHQLETAAFGSGKEFSLLQLRQLIDLGGELSLAACLGQKLVGYVLAAKSFQQEKIWVLSIAVLPEYQRTGVAQRLIEEFLVRAKNCGGREVLSTVEPHNSASQGLLRHFGCTEIAREKNYFGPGEERLVMKLEVK